MLAIDFSAVCKRYLSYENCVVRNARAARSQFRAKAYAIRECTPVWVKRSIGVGEAPIDRASHRSGVERARQHVRHLVDFVTRDAQ